MLQSIDSMTSYEYRYIDSSVSAHESALRDAQSANRPHSLIHSRRFWQPVASAPGVVAWGYAYENGQFNRIA